MSEHETIDMAGELRALYSPTAADESRLLERTRRLTAEVAPRRRHPVRGRFAGPRIAVAITMAAVCVATPTLVAASGNTPSWIRNASDSIGLTSSEEPKEAAPATSTKTQLLGQPVTLTAIGELQRDESRVLLDRAVNGIPVKLVGIPTSTGAVCLTATYGPSPGLQSFGCVQQLTEDQPFAITQDFAGVPAKTSVFGIADGSVQAVLISGPNGEQEADLREGAFFWHGDNASEARFVLDSGHTVSHPLRTLEEQAAGYEAVLDRLCPEQPDAPACQVRASK